MESNSTFEQHKATPEISIDNHVKLRQLELSEFVSHYKTIYLDTNFWLTLRKVALGELTDPLSKRYYDLVNLLSEQKICLFPISDSTFLEVLKQSDPVTLNETASIIDRLSKGISLICYDDRISLETLHYLYDKTGDSTYRTNQLVWTKLSYVMGYTSPVNNVNIDLNNLIQKSFFDHMWEISLSEMISIMRENGGVIDTSFKDISEKLNEGKFSHVNENRSFKQMFLSELAGMIDVYKPLIQQAMFHIYKKKTGCNPSEQEIESGENYSATANMIYNLFKLNKITTEFPSYRITSGLHAAVRQDKNQKYQANDMHDFRHASAALPYCDYFFTEGRLSHLITQKMLSYNELYGCCVKGNVDGAVKSLERIND